MTIQCENGHVADTNNEINMVNHYCPSCEDYVNWHLYEPMYNQIQWDSHDAKGSSIIQKGIGMKNDTPWCATPPPSTGSDSPGVHQAGMTKAQEEHLTRIQSQFHDLVNDKYRAGQKEHGGDLWKMSVLKLIDCAIEETIDQFVYLSTLRDKIL